MLSIEEIPTQELLEELLPVDPKHRQVEIYREICERNRILADALNLALIGYKEMLTQTQSTVNALKVELVKLERKNVFTPRTSTDKT